jgi:hypothetical protein
MRVTVKTTTGAAYTLEFEGTDTVASLKEKVHTATQDHPAQQRLMLNSNDIASIISLDDSRTLADCGVQHDGTLYLIVRPPPAVVQLNVGGCRYTTKLATLLARADSKIFTMFEGLGQGGRPLECVVCPEGIPGQDITAPPLPLPVDADGAYFIDRDGGSFRFVLQYLRSLLGAAAAAPGQDGEPEPEAADAGPGEAQMELPTSAEDLRRLGAEAEFFGLEALAAGCHQQRRQPPSEAVPGLHLDVLRNAHGIAFGDHCIEVGPFRIGAVDRCNHLCIGHREGKTIQVFRQDGAIHPGPREDWNPWSKELGKPSGIALGNHCIQIGSFRIGAVRGHKNRVDCNHLCIGHCNGKTIQIYRQDGTRHPGPREDFNPWSMSELGTPTGIEFGNHCIQIGAFRIGEISYGGGVIGNHLCIGHCNGQTVQIFRGDGTLHPGPRADHNPWGIDLYV